MPKVPGRKRLTRPKSHGASKKPRTDDDGSESDTSSSSSSYPPGLDLSNNAERPSSSIDYESPSSLEITIDIDSDCSLGPFSPTLSILSGGSTPDLRDESILQNDSDSSSSITPEPPEIFKKPKDVCDAPIISSLSDEEKTSLLFQCQQKLRVFLRSNWTSIVDVDGMHLLMLSRKFEKSVQRRLYISVDGNFQFSVHCKPIPIDRKNLFECVREKKPLNQDNLNYFVDRIVDAVNCICKFEICTGVSCEEFKTVWNDFPGGVIDRNPYQEHRYSETIRSQSCEFLVNSRSWRCKSCANIYKPLRLKAELDAKEVLHPNIPNSAMTKKQKDKKLCTQQKLVRNQRRTLEKLSAKIKELIQKEGVYVDSKTSDDLHEILSTADLSEEQSLFLQQQLKASKVKKACGMRWHPTMIRFALQIYMNSKKVYSSLLQTGMIKLPSQRTLFDYTHFKPVREGVDFGVIEDICERLKECKENYQQYHVLCDEMYICKNLVYDKSSGCIVGFCSMSEVREELQALPTYLNNDSEEKVSRPIASKVFSYMVRGVANNVKEVVASFSVDQLSKELLYAWSWEVISKLEAAGVAVIAFVMDGSSVNRAFIKMHKPVSNTESGVVFDTVNKAAPHRVLYFLSDVPHLLRTIRNCFQRSTEKKFIKKNGKVIWKRCMKKNGQYILWKTITRIYNEEKDKPLRQCHKLNASTVFLNAYSCMNVSLAAHVLSNTVSKYLELQNWPNSSETAIFIKNVNDWFDMMNGNYFTEGERKKNINLSPYENVNDFRFQKLEEFLQYLHEWKVDAEECADNETLNASCLSSASQNNPDDPGEVDPNAAAVGIEEEDETASPASMRQLSYQTLEGIEIAVRGFTGAVKFLLREGVKKINARVFCQDPIEQFFSKQRYKGGRNPTLTVQQFQWNQNLIHQQGQMGSKMSFGKGNTLQPNERMEISSKPLRKRKSLFCLQMPTE